MIVLFAPVVIEHPAPAPIAMLLPVEFATTSALNPNAILFEPTVLSRKVSVPMPILLEPVVFDRREFDPIEEFASPSVLLYND